MKQRFEALEKVAVAIACLAWTGGAPAAAQQSLTLREAIRIGLAQAPEARASSDRVEVQRAQGVQAKLRPNPRLYLQSEDLRPWDHAFSFPENTEDYGYVSETFELAGKRGKRVAYASSSLRTSEAQHAAELRQLAGSIALAYWNAVAASAAAAAWKVQSEDFERMVQYQAERVKAGATAGVDLLRTQVERDRVMLSYDQAQQTAELAGIELARAMASPLAKNALLLDSTEQERPVTPVATTEAVEQRPDVVAAHEAVNAARADVRLQRADGVPNLDLLGGYKRNSGVNTLYGGLQMDLPFFNRNQGGIAASAATQQLAEDQLAYARMAATAQVESALASYRRQTDLVRNTLPGMDQRAEQNAGIVAEAYRSGGTDLLRYLDAQRVLLETRLLAAETWAAYQRSVVSLELAYGEEP